METQIGTQIRNFRLRASMTQEMLAEKLNVTAQTISKWENQISCPDITLLPELTAVLGMTLDELFQTSTETHLRRIERMLEHEISDQDFSYAYKELKQACCAEETRPQALQLLSELHLRKAEELMKLASDYAKQALELEPFDKHNHSLLNIASNAHVWDWCATEHSEYISYYKKFTQAHPEYAMGYEWLISNLIEDHRLPEAEEVLEKMKAHQDECHLHLYKGWILYKSGKHAEAEECWNQMILLDPSWLSYSFRGDIYASIGQYDKAIACFKKADELEDSPKYTDNWLSIAQIEQIQNHPDLAIQAYEKALEILQKDHGLYEGKQIDDIKEKIASLKH